MQSGRSKIRLCVMRSLPGCRGNSTSDSTRRLSGNVHPLPACASHAESSLLRTDKIEGLRNWELWNCPNPWFDIVILTIHQSLNS